jgi:hypothetical protein
LRIVAAQMADQGEAPQRRSMLRILLEDGSERGFRLGAAPGFEKLDGREIALIEFRRTRGVR